MGWPEFAVKLLESFQKNRGSTILFIVLLGALVLLGIHYWPRPQPSGDQQIINSQGNGNTNANSK